MTRNHARVRGAVWIALLRERGPVMLVIAVLLAFAAWRVVGHWDGRLSRCLYACEHAHTACRHRAGGHDPHQCPRQGDVPGRSVRGSLDRYRQSIETGRVPQRG
ncbi:MAG TPA: hypothetical protein VFT45_11950 [Longimicrobium sp.]|nr:hypothetical protein [Longimicrobium sp.]